MVIDRSSNSSGEIVVQDSAIDRLELAYLVDLNAFVDLMHGLADEPEFYHRAMILYEPRI